MKLGIFIIVAVVVLGGAGYLVFGSARSSVTVENPTVTNNQEPAADSGDQMADDERKVEGENQEPGTTNLPRPSFEDPTAPMGLASPERERSEQEIGQSNAKGVTEANTAKEVTFSIKNRFVSFGFEKASGRTIDTVVLHSSYNNTGGDEYSVDSVIGIWKSYGVAPHYLIDRKGNIYRLVEDKNIAYHAGVSEVPDGRTGVNKFSIGIEMLNSLDDKYTDSQYKAARDLVAYLKGKYKIKYVLGHDDIAPGRKTDPWNFDWKKLK